MTGPRYDHTPTDGPVNGHSSVIGHSPVNGHSPLNGHTSVNGHTPVDGHTPGQEPGDAPGYVRGYAQWPGDEPGYAPAQGPGYSRGPAPVPGRGDDSGYALSYAPGPGRGDDPGYPTSHAPGPERGDDPGYPTSHAPGPGDESGYGPSYSPDQRPGYESGHARDLVPGRSYDRDHGRSRGDESGYVPGEWSGREPGRAPGEPSGGAPVPATADAAVHTPRRGLSVAVVLVGVFVSSLDLFIVNIAFPDLESSFPDSSLTSLSWVLSAYAIAFAALLMPAGRWADRSGRKRAFLIGLALFTVASAACAAAPSLGALVAARVLQAIGGALMLPSSLGLLLPLFPPEKRGAALGLWSAMGGAAAALGPPIGGLLVQADWRWVFLVNIPIGIVAVLIGARTLREVREESRVAPDVAGALVLAATVAAAVAAIVQGQSWGWSSPRILALIAFGVLGTAVSTWRAARHPAPVIEPAIVRIRAVALADVATMFFFAGFGAMILASTLFLTQVWGHTVLRAGMEIAPGPLMAAAFAVPGGLLAAKRGPRLVGMIGCLLFAVGGVWWATMPGVVPHYLVDFLPGGIIAGVGAGLVLPSLSAAATLPLPPDRFSTGTALMSMCRQVGLALGVAVVAAVLAVRPDVHAFHNAWWFMAACGLGGGLILGAIGAARARGRHRLADRQRAERAQRAQHQRLVSR